MEVLQRDEVDRIFAAINTNRALGARNAAVVSVMLDTGLRLSEIAGLEEEDVHLEDRHVKVLGKRNKERVVAFGAACQRSLLRYYHHFRGEPARPGIDSFSLTINGYPLTSEAIKSLFGCLVRAAPVPRLYV